LQAAQNASNSDNQEELKSGVKYAETFLNIMEKSSLMKDLEKNTLTKNFTREQIDEWLTYAKIFRAQSYFNITGTPEATIVSAYEALMNTKYKSVAYNSLSNYYRETDKAKQNKYLVAGIEALKDDPEQKDLRANFAFIHMQNLYNGGNYKSEDKEELKKAIQLIKDEFSDEDNAVNAYLMDGQMAFDEKKYAEAKEIYQAAKAKFPDEERCLIMAARSAWMIAQTNGSKKADLEEAIKLFKELEAATPSEPEFWGESLYILYNNTQQTALAAKYKKYYKAK
jgi:predicted Zn-dependent protease